MSTSFLAMLRRAAGWFYPSTYAFLRCKAKAEQGDAEAQSEVGNCYHIGKGVERNDIEALKWWRKAAEQNNAEAQIDLGGCYQAGRAVKQDYLEAMKWFRQAAEQNHPFAQFTLSFYYANGRGVPKDYVEAYAWCSLTDCAWPAEEVARNCNNLASAMSPQQVAEGKQRAVELRAQIEAGRKRSDK